MSKLTAKRRRRNGQNNGLAAAAQKGNGSAKIAIIDYDKTHAEEKEAKTAEECFPYRDKQTTTWIKIDGIPDAGFMEKLGKHFNFHPLILEEIANAEQRPKMEDFGTYIFVTLKTFNYDETVNEISAEQVSMILGENFVISLREKDTGIFNQIRDRLRNEKSRIREKGADYLLYALMDAIVDSYFAILEKLGEDIDEIEVKLVTNPKPATLRSVYNLKRELIFLRKSVWPLREVISGMETGDSPLIRDTRVYFRDLYDHAAQAIDTIEIFREILSGMLDVYLSSLSNKMNEIMKVLTIIATIFIPLTFVVGIYGMNFRYMPELQWQYGYPSILLLTAAIGVGMLLYFRKRKWF